MTTSPADDLDYATELARSAAAVALRHYGHVERLTKTHAAAQHEAVTQADRDVQAHVVAALRSRYPSDGVVGEEDDAGRGITADIPDPAGRVWVIDPIDGTNNFIAGFGHFAVCIGLLERGMPVLGVVHDVVAGVTYRAARGCGMWVNGTRTRCLTTPMGDSSVLMLTSNLLLPDGRLPGFVSRWLSQTNWKVRVIGSAALEAALVAAGVAHGAVTINGKLWDVAAAAALVLEAGGCVVGLDGRDVFPFELRNYGGAKVPFLACGPAARETLVAEVTRA
ncbi:MAG: inositol monophosphatase family protein [Tepidisphaerales bacterium]